MSFFDYIKDRAIPLLIMGASIVFVALVVWVLGYNVSALVAVVLILLMALIAASVWDYLSKRRFYSELREALDSENEPVYLTEFTSKPGFREGQLTYEALEGATKEMNDHIASYRLASQEYREHIETWIHEIKTPIASARLTLSNNQDDPMTPSLEHDFDRIEGYIDQALYYSRSATVEKDYLIKKINLDELVKTVVKKNSRTLIEHGISPQLDNLDVEVYSDPKWLEFIVNQIVANSIKYRRSKDESHEPCVTFSARTTSDLFESEYVIFTIADNGTGIPKSDISRVFEKGFTGENGRRFARSTGLGLYLCKKLCEKIKLSIDISSTEGEGTAVSIRFPLSKMYFLK
jgi:signal transduction histidine kinase